MHKLSITILATLFLIACGAETEKPVEPEQKAGSVTPDRAAEIHARAIVIDAHADIEIPGSPSPYVGDDGRSQVAPDKMRAGGVDVVVSAAAVGPGPRNAEGYAAARATADSEIAAVYGLAEDPANNLVVATTADEIEAAHAKGQLVRVLAMQNALILGDDPAQIDSLFEAGVRVFALTHMGHNDYADSSRPIFDGATGKHETEAEHGGLSELGVAAVQRVNNLGGIMDVSQLSTQATLQVVATSTDPVIASHSNARALTAVSRNLSDAEIDAIAAKGGVIHVAPFRGYLFDSTNADLDAQIRAARIEAGVKEDYYYPFELYWEIDDPEARAAFTGAISDLLGPGSVDAMLNHLDYIVERVGVDHVGIGTDFNHGSRVTGYKDASEALNVTRALVERGYSDEDIIKIWGGNFLRVMRTAEAD